MSIVLDQIAIPQSVQQTAQSSLIVIPDGCTCGRFEPIVSGTDWSSGLIVSMTVDIFVGATQIDRRMGTLERCTDRSGNVAPPFQQLSDLAPTAGVSVKVTISANRQTSIGARICAADSLANLPATLPPPV